MGSPLHLAFIAGSVYFLLVTLVAPRRLRRPLAVLGLALFLVALPFQQGKYANDVWTDYAVYTMAAISLNMLTGRTGQISLGQGAFLAISAYTVAIMIAQHHVPFYEAALVGALLTTLLGLVLGLPAVRLTGPYLAIATLGLAISLPTVGKWVKIERWTGGNQGISVVKLSQRPYLPHVPGWFPALPGGHRLQPDEFTLFLTLLVAACCALIVWNVGRGRTGRMLVAVRDSEPAAEAVGIRPATYKVIAFMISAFIAGLSGAFLALSVGSVHPDAFGLDLSIAILAMIVIGGLDSILGSVAGAVVIRWLTLNTTKLPAPTDIPALGSHLPAAFKTFPTYAAGVYYGVALILIMILMPYGLAGAYYRLLRLIDRLRSSRHPGADPSVAVGSGGEQAITNA